MVSALVLLPVLLVLTYAGGIWFAGFCGIAACVVVWEFSTLVRLSLPNGMWLAMLGVVAVVVVTCVGVNPHRAFQVTAAGIAVLALVHLAMQGKIWAATGVAYAAMPFLALVLLRGDTEKGLHAILFVFACVIATDTFAYFAGRAIGGPRLAPKTSPNKTWSGFFGGLAGSVIVSLALLALLGYAPGWRPAVLALVLSLFSQGGDLFESWIKRRFDKKDSGNLIPGHGGLLDRIDGLIFASMAAWLVAVVLGAEPFGAASAGSMLIDAIVLP